MKLSDLPFDASGYWFPQSAIWVYALTRLPFRVLAVTRKPDCYHVDVQAEDGQQFTLTFLRYDFTLDNAFRPIRYPREPDTEIKEMVNE